MSKSWNIPGFDVYDPSLVLYAPLWRPDMVARGGSIKNGTGTMDVNPQALAVGANTITVTAAGTLIVAMPEGGTVQSGTMTVTGSPVTVSAGIQTTITTTGAIGNITVTPSNIIRSKGRNNHALTVTGATRGYQGGTLDGSDDKIDCGTSSVLNFGSGSYSVGIWAYYTTAAIDKPYFASTDASNRRRIDLRSNAFSREATVGGIKEQSFVEPTANAWHQIAGVYDSVAATLGVYKDAALIGPTSNVTGTLADATDNLIGRSTNINVWFTGTIGEVSIHNRALTDGEILQNFQVTKWRYQ